LPAEDIRIRYVDFCGQSGRRISDIYVAGTVVEAVEKALELALHIKGADSSAIPMIYIGGSTYVVSEAVAHLATVRA
jgi:hypothetical protein